MKSTFTIMKRDHKTGKSEPVEVIIAENAAEAKSKFHLKGDTYDSAQYSYWVKFPVCR